MSYTMADFTFMQKRERRAASLTEAVQGNTRTLALFSKVTDFVEAKRKQKQDDEDKKFLAKEMYQRLAASEEDEDDTPAGHSLLMRMLKFIGKKFLKYVMRPVMNFAMRVVGTLVRVVLRSLVAWVIEPLIAGIAAFAVANPITFAVAAAALIGGAGWWIWKKFFKEDKAPPAVPTGPKTAPVLGAPEYGGTADVEAATRIVTPAPTTGLETPVTFAKVADLQNLVRQTKNAKFAGFGADIDADIKEASKRFNLPEDILRGFIKMEDGWTGKMSPTGAIGTGQFIQSTWDALAGTADGAAIGMTKIGKRFRTPEDPRFDKRINTLATALLAKNNATILTKYGLPVTGENLYMMHNIGPGIIDVMLGKQPSAQTLLAMRQNGMLPGQTASDFLTYQKGRFNAQYAIANRSATDIAAAETPATGKAVTKDRPAKKLIVQGGAQDSGGASVKDSTKLDREIVPGKGKTLIGVS